MRPEPSNPGGGTALRSLAALSLAVAVAIPLVSFACLFPLVENMPTWDQWHLIGLWSAYYEGRPVLPLLLAPYNGHLNLLPRLIFFGMGVLSHWDVRLDIIASYDVNPEAMTTLHGVVAPSSVRWTTRPARGSSIKTAPGPEAPDSDDPRSTT